MSLWEIYKAKRLGYADDLWTSLIGKKLGGYSWISTDYEQTPYIYRAMPNMSHYYNREIMEEVVGGSVGWNQLIQNGNFADGKTHWGADSASVSVENNIATVTVSALSIGQGLYQGGLNSASGHKYFISADFKFPYSSVTVVLRLGSASGQYSTSGSANVWETLSTIRSASTSQINASLELDVDTQAFVIGDVYYVKNVYLTDLTLALGSTIADYVYSLEQSTAGSGVAWLKEHFPKMFGQYNPYDSGSIQSVSGLVSHDMVGFNAWDEEWKVGAINSSTGQEISADNRIISKNYIPCLPNTAYYFKGTFSNGVFFYDADKNYLSADTKHPANAVVTTPTNARYIKFCLAVAYGTIYKNDICINLSDASKNGTYEPYHRNSYPLDSTVTLRGIPKLDNGKLYYDGDTYGADGTVNRKYGIRPYQSGDESLADAVTDGTNTVYKLATPTTETAQPFTKTQKCDSGGTEEFITSGIVSVGHKSKYAEK